MNKNRENQKKFYHRRVDNGSCYWCGQPRDREGAYCSRCLEIYRGQHKRLMADLNRRGVCNICHKAKASLGYTTCERCRQRVNERAKMWYRSRHPKAGEANG